MLTKAERVPLRGIAALMLLLTAVVTGCSHTEPPLRNREIPTPVAGQGGTPAPTQPALGESYILDFCRRQGNPEIITCQALPYVGYVTAITTYRGVVIDLAREIDDRLLLSSNIRSVNCDEAIESLQALADKGSILLHGPGYRPEELPEDMEYVTMGERGYCLLARAEDDRFSEVEDIRGPGVVVAVVSGTDAEYVLARDYPEVEVRRIDAKWAEASISEVLSGMADVTFIYSSVAPVFLAESPQLAVFPADCLDRPVWPMEWGAIIPKDDQVLIQYLRDLVAELEESGWFEERLAHWTDPDILRTMRPFTTEEMWQGE